MSSIDSQGPETWQMRPMPLPGTPHEAHAMFTAARIAHVLGRDKRGILRALRRIPASGKVLVQRGQLADAWNIHCLPSNYRLDLDRIVKVKGYRNAAHLLADGYTRWRPDIPLSEIAKHHITFAVRLKNAFTRAIGLYLRADVEMGAIRKAAWEDYQTEFGAVCERTARRSFDRVLMRDSGDENFDDLSLYLGDRLSREKGNEALLPGLLSPHEQAVHKYLSAVKIPSEPTVGELDLIWFSVCEVIQQQIDCGVKAKAARRSLITFLEASAVRLSRNAAALKKLLKLKLARYAECGGDFNLMCDQRSEKSGWKRAHVLSDRDRQLIVAHAALQKGGRLAPAIRELRESGELSCEFEEHHLTNPVRKSYVPCSIRTQVQPDVRRLKNMVHGSRTHQLKGAYLTRDYSTMFAGDWFQADDVTLPVYYWEETEKGIEIMRGQVLLMIDVRTDYVLGYVLISARNYNSLAIRSLITVVGLKHGLPRRGFYFENGVWRSSKIISGSAIPWEHADRGLKELGMKLVHARLPRAKVVERMIGQLQNRMEAFPGYAGRDERHDVRERAQRLFLDIKAGRLAANEHLLSREQYGAELSRCLERHNAEAQEGRLDGLSPEEAWQQLQGEKPRQGFGSQWRYVLASDKRKVKVGRNGITLQYGKKKFVYRGAETGKRVGEEVIAWFDPMNSDQLACTDLDHKNVFSVERSNAVPAMDASEDQLRDEMGKIDAHQEAAKTLYWTSKNILQSANYISTVVDPATIKIGSDMAAQREEITARNEARKMKTRANRSVIETKQLPRELLASADSLSTEALNLLGDFLKPTPEEQI